MCRRASDHLPTEVKGDHECRRAAGLSPTEDDDDQAAAEPRCAERRRAACPLTEDRDRRPSRTEHTGSPKLLLSLRTRGGCRLDLTRTQYSAARSTEDGGLDDDDDPVTVELWHRDASSVAVKEEDVHGCTQSDAATLVAEE